MWRWLVKRAGGWKSGERHQSANQPNETRFLSNVTVPVVDALFSDLLTTQTDMMRPTYHVKLHVEEVCKFVCATRPTAASCMRYGSYCTKTQNTFYFEGTRGDRRCSLEGPSTVQEILSQPKRATRSTVEEFRYHQIYYETAFCSP